MATFKAKAEEFMAQKKIAVVGVSGTKSTTGNVIMKSLRAQGYEVFPVNPNADMVDGVACYPSVKALPEPVDGVLIVTRPDVTEQVVRDCVAAKVPRVWMHENAFAGKRYTSVSTDAADYARSHGLTVIEGGCPLMFVDFGHKCMRWMLGALNKLPN